MKHLLNQWSYCSIYGSEWKIVHQSHRHSSMLRLQSLCHLPPPQYTCSSNALAFQACISKESYQCTPDVQLSKKEAKEGNCAQTMENTVVDDLLDVFLLRMLIPILWTPKYFAISGSCNWGTSWTARPSDIEASKTWIPRLIWPLPQGVS